MPLMRIQIAKIAPSILSHRVAAFMNDASLPLSVRGMINVHMTSPWIPNFWSVAIRAAKPGSERYFDFPIGYAEDGTSWFFPSRQWWLAHSLAGHPPDGTSCDADVHSDFLSSDGKAHEFDYAAVFQDGTMKILGRADFSQECFFWQHAFSAPEAQP